MFKRFIQQITRLFGSQNVAYSRNPNPNIPTNTVRHSLSYADASVRGSRRPFPVTDNARFRRRELDLGYRHSATKLLRDGHLQIAVIGFNDNAFSISPMTRHDSPGLELAVSELTGQIKPLPQRNIAAGLLSAFNTLDDNEPGRRGIILITSGDAEAEQSRLQILATEAAAKKIGVHVIALGAKPGYPTCAPRISTRVELGYGCFRMTDSADQLMDAIRAAFSGLTPAFGMRGANKVVILLDCSEVMAERYRNNTRMDLVVATLQEFLETPLPRPVRNGSFEGPSPGKRCVPSSAGSSRHSLQTEVSVRADGCSEWSPGRPEAE